MKKLIASLLMVAGALGALAQGTVTFNTFNANATLGQVFLSGTTGPGPAFVGQLYWADAVGGPFTAAGTPQNFGVGSDMAYVLDGGVAIPSHLPGTAVFISMYVWNQNAGASYETAQSSSSLLAFGTTQAKSRTLGGPDPDGGPPFNNPQYNNFPNLTLTVVPEPSTIALAGLGLASLLIFRRRK